MKSKFKVILLTMFFITCFGVLAYADTPCPVLPSGYKYMLVYKYKCSWNPPQYTWQVYCSNVEPVVSGYSISSMTLFNDEGGQFKLQGNNSTLANLDKNDVYGIIYSTNFDLKDSTGKIFFRKPQEPYWAKANLGGILTQIRPIAIIVVGFLVLLIALRKGFRLLQTVLRGL